MAPDSTFAFAGGWCCPALDFVFAFWIILAFDTLLTSLFYVDFEIARNSSVVAICIGRMTNFITEISELRITIYL
jgi:hypothetical protein